MHFSRKYLAIIALVIILVVTNVALAVLYMTRSVNISGGVSVVGAIEVYDEDGVTPLTSYDFPLFTGGNDESFYKTFYINNTGSQPVYVYWNISSSSIVWNPQEGGYQHYDGMYYKYYFYLRTYPDAELWSPNDFYAPESLYLVVDESVRLRIRLWYTGSPTTAETFTLTMSFYAQDA